MFQKKTSRIYLLILLCAAVLYGCMAAADRIWADEAYTFAMIRHSFPEIWRITAADVHPPLYYFAAKVFSFVFGTSQYSLRLFSALFYLAIMAIGGSQLSRLFNRKTGLLFMLLFPLYPFSLEYAVEVRMYSMAALAIFLNALFAYRAWVFNRPLDWVGFAAAGICAAYTHYFSLVSAGVIYGFLFLCIVFRKRNLLKPWLIASAVTIVLYLPWLKCFIEQLAFKVSNDYWIEPITFGTLINYALSLLHANGHSLFPVFFGLLVLALTVLAIIRKDGVSLFALAVPVLTVLLGVGVSILIRPIFVIRYLAPCGPLLILFLAHSLGQLKKEQLCTAAAAVLIVSFTGNLMIAVMDLLPGESRIDRAFAEENAQAQAYVVTTESALHVSQVLSYYQPETPVYTTEVLGAASPYTNDRSLTTFSPEELDTFIVLTDAQSGPDRMFTEGFQATHLGTRQAAFDTVEVWLLTKQ